MKPAGCLDEVAGLDFGIGLSTPSRPAAAPCRVSERLCARPGACSVPLDLPGGRKGDASVTGKTDSSASKADRTSAAVPFREVPAAMSVFTPLADWEEVPETLSGSGLEPWLVRRGPTRTGRVLEFSASAGSCDGSCWSSEPALEAPSAETLCWVRRGPVRTGWVCEGAGLFRGPWMRPKRFKGLRLNALDGGLWAPVGVGSPSSVCCQLPRQSTWPQSGRWLCCRYLPDLQLLGLIILILVVETQTKNLLTLILASSASSLVACAP